MRRTNTFDIQPRSKRDRLVLMEVLDTSAALWNELTYERRQTFFDGDDIWDVDANHFRVRYKGVLGSATAQQLIRENNAAWRSFFALLEKGENPSPPGYWKDGDERKLRTLVRNDQYTLEWGDCSRLEIPVGVELKEKYSFGYHERLRLEASGKPRWEGDQGRLEVVYDNDAESFRARQPVSGASQRQDTSLATVASGDAAVAALDIGANNLVAVTTSSGHQRLYHGRPTYNRFRSTTEQIADRQSELDYGEWSSRRIRRMYRRRSARRNHLQDALVRDLAEWLAGHDVDEVIVGELDDVLERHWSAQVNEKTHHFWAHGRFRRRLHEVFEGEYQMQVREEPEVGTSSCCPDCGSHQIRRTSDLFVCHECGFEGHSDIAAAENLLAKHSEGSMARPAVSRENTTERGHGNVPRLEWDDHRWRRRDHLSETNEDPANRSTQMGKLATGESGPA